MTALLVLVHDGRAVGRGPSIAPLGQSDDDGLEVQPFLGEVVLLMSR